VQITKKPLPAVDLSATPTGWVPVAYGDAQLSVPSIPLLMTVVMSPTRRVRGSAGWKPRQRVALPTATSEGGCAHRDRISKTAWRMPSSLGRMTRSRRLVPPRPGRDLMAIAVI
jgi:hypothetical protein